MDEHSAVSEHVVTAKEAGLVSCTHCARVWPIGTAACARCGARLVSRDEKSMSRVWAWWFVGLLCYIPANVFPMLQTTFLARTSGDTIVGGAIVLMMHGAIPVGLVILLASVVIPIAKFIAVAYLALSVQFRLPSDQLRRMKLYELVEFIGRWSMIDVFVVAVLTALVQLSVVVSIQPGSAAVAFALAVVFTMLAARSFDSRMIWDSLETPAEAEPDDSRKDFLS
ncbi:paraquat-inducible protein A [Aliiruegeria lutimaris]|uniref:Paraquat-inducible protein A n=1 Tax=Aliiruegeria lutimaris TaxID=571298 RepID=A0A1G9HAA3_9RHOB|nr:paraquat-inducible protein A [Aliiruegeria lutimaris]SDL09928.1 paraquat-inducible protein A [Aliiruegeria lutimaris]